MECQQPKRTANRSSTTDMDEVEDRNRAHFLNMSYSEFLARRKILREQAVYLKNGKSKQ